MHSSEVILFTTKTGRDCAGFCLPIIAGLAGLDAGKVGAALGACSAVLFATGCVVLKLLHASVAVCVEAGSDVCVDRWLVADTAEGIVFCHLECIGSSEIGDILVLRCSAFSFHA